MYDLILFDIVFFLFFFFFFKQKTAYEMLRSLVGSEMCIRDRYQRRVRGTSSSMGCGASSSLTPAQQKRADREARNLKARVESANTRLSNELERSLDKAHRARDDCLNDHDWGLSDASVHREQHLQCHDATVHNALNSVVRCLEVCDRSRLDMEKASKIEHAENAATKSDAAMEALAKVREPIELKGKEYAAYWAGQVSLGADTRRFVVRFLVQRWPSEFDEERYADLYQKHIAHRKACDKGVSNKWEQFRVDRDEMLTELYQQLSTNCDALQGEFDEWRTAEGMTCVESTMTWEHTNPVASDDKRDRECFVQKDSDGQYFLLDWDSHLKQEFDKLCACVQARCNQIYICLLYTSDAADEEDSVDLGGRRIIKKKKKSDKRVE
eukprot:TRINITY_DN2357_c0_g1_i3.p1 TRINITY_DN2357_c0_g1~~TRINITY_DN2357_c0_g1_i3.p1  ORF type:complete len:383 (+),score=120.44 TRINITY_DN2357_c0_g1_i3:78-1226(+)